MVGFSAIPALDVDPLSMGARNTASMLQSMQEQQNLQTNQTLLPSMIAAKQAQYGAEAQMAPMQVQEAQNRSALQSMDVNNRTLAQVALDAQAADPEEAADVWDAGMKAASAKGVAQADQYIAHYRPDLAEKVAQAYGGGAPGGGGGGGGRGPVNPMTDPSEIARSVAQMPMPQVTKALGNLNRAINSFNTVKDQQSWDAEMQSLREAGIDVSKFLPGMDWSPINYAAASRAITNLVPLRDAMAQRAGSIAMGGPDMQPPPRYEPNLQYIGPQAGTGKPVYHDPHTGQDQIGETPIGPKPSTQMSTFLLKQQAWLNSHPGDQDGALEFANGKRNLSPQQMQAEAIGAANRQLADESLAGAVIPNPDQWVQQRAQQIYQQISGAGPQPAAARAPIPAPGARMSQQEQQQSLANAKAFIAAHPNLRDKVIARVRAAGLSPQGL